MAFSFRRSVFTDFEDPWTSITMINARVDVGIGYDDSLRMGLGPSIPR